MLTERRDESVDLGELIERLRAMLVQGLGAGKERLGVARCGHARGRPRHGTRARLLGAPAERARARRRGGAHRARAAERRRHARDRRRRRRDRAARRAGRGSRSSTRLCATSSAARCRSRTRAGCGPRSSSRPRAAAGSADELRVGRLVTGLRRAVFGHRAADEPGVLEVRAAPARAPRAVDGQGGAQLREPARLGQLGEDRQRPLLQADVLVAGERVRSAGRAARPRARGGEQYSGRSGWP